MHVVLMSLFRRHIDVVCGYHNMIRYHHPHSTIMFSMSNTLSKSHPHSNNTEVPNTKIWSGSLIASDVVAYSLKIGRLWTQQRRMRQRWGAGGGAEIRSWFLTSWPRLGPSSFAAGSWIGLQGLENFCHKYGRMQGFGRILFAFISICILSWEPPSATSLPKISPLAPLPPRPR